MIKKFLIFIALFTFSIAYTLEEINSLPSGLAKDFVIYRHLKQNDLSKDEALKLKSQIYRATYRLDELFNSFIKDEEFSLKAKCKKLETVLLLLEDEKCILTALSPSRFSKMNKEERAKVFSKLKVYFDDELSWAKAMNSKNVFASLIGGDGEDFVKVFLSVSKEYRKKFLDKKLPKDFIQKILGIEKFEHFIKEVAFDAELKKIPSSLMDLKEDEEYLSFDTVFYLGIIAVKLGKSKKAKSFFELSYALAKSLEEEEKALFWQYMISQDRGFLQVLAKNKKLSFYSLYAKEMLGCGVFKISTPRPSKEKADFFSITDPFSWDFTKEYAKKLSKDELHEFAKKFFTKETLPHYVYFSQRAEGFDKIYFINPYEEYMKNFSLKRKILIHSIARQESRHIPVCVSKSYALGLMQFMPFLIRDMSKKKALKEFEYFDIFDPKNAIDFANSHLEYLQNYLFHPLLIAYAYNGGIGFTKLMLEDGKLFQKGKFEPYLSMELVPYEESRKYGKKVISNYVIYSRIYGEDISLRYLLESLSKPELNYRF